MITSKTVFLFVCVFFLAGCVPSVQTPPPIMPTATVAASIATSTPTESQPAAPTPEQHPGATHVKELDGWFVPHGQIYLFDDPGANYPKILPFEFYLPEGINGPNIFHR